MLESEIAHLEEMAAEKARSALSTRFSAPLGARALGPSLPCSSFASPRRALRLGPTKDQRFSRTSLDVRKREQAPKTFVYRRLNVSMPMALSCSSPRSARDHVRGMSLRIMVRFLVRAEQRIFDPRLLYHATLAFGTTLYPTRFARGEEGSACHRKSTVCSLFYEPTHFVCYERTNPHGEA